MGLRGHRHSFLVVTVRAPGLPEDDPANTQNNQYVIEKVADEARNGLKVSRGLLPHYDVHGEFDAPKVHIL